MSKGKPQLKTVNLDGFTSELLGAFLEVPGVFELANTCEFKKATSSKCYQYNTSFVVSGFSIVRCQC